MFNYKVDTGVTNYNLVPTAGGGTHWEYQGRKIGPTTFERSETNSIAANYTSQIFDYFGSVPSLLNVQSYNGFLNGDRPNNINSLFSSIGRQYNQYAKYDNTQLRFLYQQKN